MKTKYLMDEIDFETIMEHKPVKILVYTAAGLVVLVFTGYLFKITAHTIRGYKELKNALNA